MKMQKYTIFVKKSFPPYTGKYRGGVYSMLKKWLNEITIIVCNCSNYDYHFIIKKLSKEFKGKVTCLRKNAGKYTSFSVPIEKQVKIIGKKEEESRKTIFYELKHIDSAICMANSLSNLVNNFLEEIHKIKCKHEHHNETCDIC